MFKTIKRIHNHIKAVRLAISLVNKELTSRGDRHDDSKFEQDELDYYAAYEKLPEGLEFGSDAYNEALKELNIGVGTPGFGLHSRRNDHHPEYWDCPEQGVDLSMMGIFSLIEMVCDWCGAHIAYGNSGDWMASVDYNINRFQFSDNQKWVIRQIADFLNKKCATKKLSELI